MKIKSLLSASFIALLAASGVYAGTLEDVKARGELSCGVSTGVTGFSNANDQGVWEGIDVDVCRAVAAAVLGDKMKVKFKPLTSKERFTALNSGEIDVLSRNTTWTFSRDVDLKLTFLGVNFYDGQGFMAKKSLGVKSAKELDGARVCIQVGTTTELNLADYFRVNKMSYEAVPVETDSEATENYLADRCDVYTTDRSGLASARAGFETPSDHVVLPEVISKEPLGPVVRHGDDHWADIVRWSLNAMIIAEEIGITSSNVDSLAAKPTNNPEINRMLGTEGSYGDMIGLDPKWVHRIIKQVGNYEESYHRNLDPIGLSTRGVNALYTKGGIVYAPPFR